MVAPRTMPRHPPTLLRPQRFRSACSPCLPRLRHSSAIRASRDDHAPPTQTHPLGAYYDAILSAPSPPTPVIHGSSSESPPPNPIEPPPDPAPSPPSSPLLPTTAEQKARVLFGSRLAGPGRSIPATPAKGSTVIAGVRVPSKPEEPDNCCMSGCVNCVWERYREDLEEWAARAAEAGKRLAVLGARGDRKEGDPAAKKHEAPSRPKIPVPPPVADRQASRPRDDVATDKKIAKDLWDDELYKNVPVGIREFMRHEKRLKEMHDRENTRAGSG